MQFYCQNRIRPKKDTKLCLLLKNGVGRYNIFFNFYTKLAESSCFGSFSYRIHQCVCSSTIWFVPCAFFINKQFRTCANAFPNEFTVRSYEYCTGKHWILYWIQENKTAKWFLPRISFVLGYLRMILWKISTAISIKHRILATFNNKNKFNSDSDHFQLNTWI